jgi:hypothetical protein
VIPTAMDLPYFFITDDIVHVPDGGLKSKAMIQAAFIIVFRSQEQGQQQSRRRR